MKKHALLSGLLLVAVVSSFAQSLPNVYEVPDSNNFRTLSSAYPTVVYDGSLWVRTAGSRTSNGGTIQTGPTGYYYARQYSGPVNVRWFGAKGDKGITNDRASIQKAINTREDVYLPAGVYRIVGGLVMRNNSLTGDGPSATYINVDSAAHGIFIPNGSFNSREVKRFSGFAIGSYNGKTLDKYAFYFEPTPAGQAVKYNAGISISDVEIGGQGNYGGGIYMSDCSKIDVTNVGMTMVNNPISLIGSTIQSTFINVSCFLEDAAPNSPTLPNTGLIMDYRNDYAGGKLMGPESTKLIACSFVRYNIGVEYRFGLYAVFDKLDVDYYKQYGFLLKYESCRILNSWMSTATTNAKAVAIKLIPSGFTPGDLYIQNNQINAYNVLDSTSNAIELGDNAVSPYRFSWGGHIYGNTFTGPAGAWNYGIQADRTRGIVIRDNVMADGLCTKKAINLTYCRHALVSGNILQTGKIYLEAPQADSFGSVTDNNADVTTYNILTPANWQFARNVKFTN